MQAIAASPSFENRLTFGKVMGKSLVSRFLTRSVENKRGKKQKRPHADLTTLRRILTSHLLSMTSQLQTIINTACVIDMCRVQKTSFY